MGSKLQAHKLLNQTLFACLVALQLISTQPLPLTPPPSPAPQLLILENVKESLKMHTLILAWLPNAAR